MFGNKGFFGSSGSVQGALWWTLCRDYMGALRNNHSDLCFSYHRAGGALQGSLSSFAIPNTLEA